MCTIVYLSLFQWMANLSEIWMMPSSSEKRRSGYYARIFCRDLNCRSGCSMWPGTSMYKPVTFSWGKIMTFTTEVSKNSQRMFNWIKSLLVLELILLEKCLLLQTAKKKNFVRDSRVMNRRELSYFQSRILSFSSKFSFKCAHDPIWFCDSRVRNWHELN